MAGTAPKINIKNPITRAKTRQVDMAINHFIEARANGKAVGACLTSRQWSKAAQLVETLDGDSARPHLRSLARHHEEAGNHALAERFFVDADAPQLAVEMYTKVRSMLGWARDGGRGKGGVAGLSSGGA